MASISGPKRRELMDRYGPLVFDALFHTGYRVRREIAWRDLLKVGRMGLHLAVADYDAGREMQFTRRARRCIRRAVTDWLAYLEIKPGPRPAPRRRCSQFIDSYAGVSFPEVRRALRK